MSRIHRYAEKFSALSSLAMSPVRRSWAWEGLRTHRLGLERKPRDGQRTALFITSSIEICRSQVHPFFFYRRQIEASHGYAFHQIDIERFQARRDEVPADIVVVQPWFQLGADGISRLLEDVRRRCSPRRLVFLDSYAPTDLRFASVVDPYVDFYVKKHVLRDRTEYGRPVIGDTNLTDYYNKLYGLHEAETRFEVPPGFFEQKLLVGPSFATQDWMLEEFLQGELPSGRRDIDLHARLATRDGGWYGAMRTDATERAEKLTGVTTLARERVSPEAYIEELKRSKICFSPFGFGEVAWRDYEAVACGALLLKPSMAHCETDPDIFIAGKTYVPIQWDFSDLEEKVRYYLDHPEESREITQNAFAALRRYFREERFLRQMAPLFTWR